MFDLKRTDSLKILLCTILSSLFNQNLWLGPRGSGNYIVFHYTVKCTNMTIIINFIVATAVTDMNVVDFFNVGSKLMWVT